MSTVCVKHGLFAEEIIHPFEYMLWFSGEVIIIGFMFQFNTNLEYFQIANLLQLFHIRE